MDKIKYICVNEIARPLKTAFSTSLGSKNIIRSVLVKITLANGASGLGEIPTSFSLKHETIPVIKNILKSVSSQFINFSINDYEEKITGLRKKFFKYPMTISGLEVALFRAYLKHKNTTEHVYWGAKSLNLETDITIPFTLDNNSLTKWMNFILSKDFKIYKLKVSGKINQDKKILSSVYSILKNELNEFIIRLDGNQGYTQETFLKMLDFIEKNDYSIQLFEQPLKKNDYKGLKFIKKHSTIPIILDETIFTNKDLEYAIEHNLADGANIKIAKSGISESAKIIKTAKEHNLKLMIGCMTETMAGLSAAIYFSAGTNAFDFIDLDSVYFLHYANQYDKISINNSGFTIM